MCAAFVISASYDKQIRFWDGSSGRTVRCFSFQDSQVNALLLIPNTTYLVVAGFGVLRIYDISATGSGRSGSSSVGGANQSPPLFSSYENQSAMNFTSLGSFPISSPNGVMSMIDSSGSNTSIFDKTVDLGATQRPMEETSDDAVSVLYATSEDGHIRFFNSVVPTALQLLRDISTGAAITCSALSADRQTLLTGSQIGRVSVWHLPTIMAVATQQSEGFTMAPFGNKPLQEIAFENDYTALRSIAIDPLARWAVTATNAGKLHFLRFLMNRDAEAVEASASNATKPPCDEHTAVEPIAVSNGIHATELVEANCSQGSVVQHSESIYRSAIASTGNADNCIDNAASFNVPCGSFISALPNSLDPGTAKVDVAFQPKEGEGEESENNKNKETPSNVNDVLSSSSTPQLSPLLQKFVMEVFHSFQAHYKYILKVAISPNADLLVTCCADYTVGRFGIPPELQVTRSACNENNEEFAASGHNKEAQSASLLSVQDDSVIVPVLDSSKPKQEGKVEEGDTQTSCGIAAATSGEAKASDVSPSGPPHDATKESSQRMAEANGANDKKETCPRELNDTSSMVSSVMPSLGGEGQDPLLSGGATYFKVLKPLTGHTRWVWDCVFSGCGQYLLTASSDHYLRMWNGLMTDRVQSTCFAGHTKPVICCILYYEKKAPQ